ncbi:MAG: biotin--[acetyl-CoA-carboxylase] ligase [Desulfofustis sp.]|nr:biotin--[acetyl-CoA-carboxylase] ligase [Desulfofustis sp.]
MGYQDLFLQTTESTNRVAKEMGASGVAHGSGVVADTQTAGRGRLGRQWHSPPGCNLYCSYVIRPDIDLQDYPKLTMVAGVAAAQCVQDHSSLAVGLKWPNDLYIDTRKCGGILCEASPAATPPFAVIGIGINCNLNTSDIPEELKDRATSLLIEGGCRINPQQLFVDLRKHLLDAVNDFEKQGFSQILTRWSHFDTFQGTHMSWVREDGKPIEGISLGPDLDGSLVVQDADGNRHKVISGDVTLVGSVPMERS